jgi:hypothetical protein
MEKLKNKIEKYINKTGVIKTPAYFIKDLFNNVVDYFSNKIKNIDNKIIAIKNKNDIYYLWLNYFYITYFYFG